MQTTATLDERRTPRHPLPALIAVLILLAGCSGAAAPLSPAGTPASASPSAAASAAITGSPGSVSTTPSPKPASIPSTTVSWRAAGTMHLAHVGGGAALRLGDGRVLVVGSSVFDSYTGHMPDDTTRFAEAWDPATGAWRLVTALPKPRDLFAAVVVRDGRAMVIGGMNAEGASYSSCYFFDPKTDAWVKAGQLGTARFGAAAAVLRDGRVLVVGGRYATGIQDRATLDGLRLAAFDPLADLDPGPPGHALALAEIYDPRTDTWTTTTGSMRWARDGASAVTLGDGRVLVSGGVERWWLPDGNTPRPELFDPATGRFSLAPAAPDPPAERFAALGASSPSEAWESWAARSALSSLASGGALLADGTWRSGDVYVEAVLRYEPSGDRWIWVGKPYVVVDDPSIETTSATWGAEHPTRVRTPLSDGTVLLFGDDVPHLERLDPLRGDWSRLSDPPKSVSEAVAVELADGSVLFAPASGSDADAYRLVLGS